MLSEALKELVTDSLVERTVYPEIPLKVCYKITEYGMTLSSIF
ncbi:winged helix-turn-helix transcriptional regulator [Paenibacillus sp. IHB B 3084]